MNVWLALNVRPAYNSDKIVLSELAQSCLKSKLQDDFRRFIITYIQM